MFDSSWRRNVPDEIYIGGGKVIEGFEQSLIGMCKGEKRSVRIPASFAYGDQGAPPHIPPGATVRYDIHCIKVRDPTAKEKLLSGDDWRHIDTNKDWIATPEEFTAYDPSKHYMSDDRNEVRVCLFLKFFDVQRK